MILGLGDLKKDKMVQLANSGYDYTLAKASEDLLMKQLKDLDDAYKAVKENRLSEYETSLPEMLGLDKMSYDAPTDEELSKKAEDTLIYDFEMGRNKLIGNIEETRNQLESGREKLNESQTTALDKLDKTYTSLKEKLSKAFLKQGIAHSSIKDTQITAAESEKVEKEGAVKNGTAEAIAELDSKIETLNKEKEDSLKAFDLAHAVKLQNELDKLIAARDKQAQDVIEYNNKVDKQEAEYLVKRADKVEDYKAELTKQDQANEEYYRENGYYPGMNEEYAERYKMAYDFYSNLPASTAQRVIGENSDLESYLGSKYYNKLRTVIAMRSS